MLPKHRRWIALGALGAAVLVGAWIVMPHVPREFTCELSMRPFRDGADAARALEVTFERGDERMQSIRVAFPPPGPPREWRHTLSLAPGAYRVTVRVETGTRVLVSSASADVRAGETLRLPVPREE